MPVETQKSAFQIKPAWLVAAGLLIWANSLVAQCPKYDRSMQNGNRLLNAGRPDEALTEFQAAQIAARECGISGDQPAAALQQAFDMLKKQRDEAVKAQFAANAAQVETLKQKERADREAADALEAKNLAETAKNEALFAKSAAEKAGMSADTARILAEKEKIRAQAALEKADRLIDAFYFYNDRFALAFKGNKYGYIGKSGETTIPYKYDEAVPFNEITGRATVRINNSEYLLDTSGKEFLTIRDVDLINPLTESIDLSNFGLSNLPKSLGSCEKLKFLRLSGNRFSSLNLSNRAAANLIQLDLSANGLSSIPASVFSLPNLEYLSFRSNKLKSADDCPKLTSLRVLDLSHNQLRELPTDLLKLQNLHRLDLTNNPLLQWPSVACELKQLQTLLLSYNKLVEMPDCIVQLQDLKHLEISSNSLVMLPDSFGLLKNMEVVNLSFNQLKELPASFSELANLKFLDLSYNQLTELPPQIRLLKKLREINLAGNRMTELPAWLADLPLLQNVYVSGNPISEVPVSLNQIIRK